MEDLEKVLKVLVPVKREIQLKDDRWCQLEVNPIRQLRITLTGLCWFCWTLQKFEDTAKTRRIDGGSELSNKRMTLANEVGKVAWWEWNYDKKSWLITPTKPMAWLHNR